MVESKQTHFGTFTGSASANSCYHYWAHQSPQATVACFISWESELHALFPLGPYDDENILLLALLPLYMQ